MDNDQYEYSDSLALGGDGIQEINGHERASGAQRTPSTAAGFGEQRPSEESPLLGDDSLPLGRTGTAESEWVGYADYEGLSVWNKPSVSLAHYVYFLKWQS